MLPLILLSTECDNKIAHAHGLVAGLGGGMNCLFYMNSGLFILSEHQGLYNKEAEKSQRNSFQSNFCQATNITKCKA